MTSEITVEALQRASLVKTYLSYFESTVEALADLNGALGTAYQHNAFWRWQNGLRDPGWKARAHMRNRVLPDVLRAHGGAHATEADVTAALAKLL